MVNFYYRYLAPTELNETPVIITDSDSLTRSEAITKEKMTYVFDIIVVTILYHQNLSKRLLSRQFVRVLWEFR